LKVPEPPFIGRQEEILFFQREAERIVRGQGEDFFYLSPKGRGKTTLLLKVKDLLFWGGSEPIPVYFSFSRPYSDLLDFSEEYLVSVLSQVLVFSQKERLALKPEDLTSFPGLQREAERQGKEVTEELIFLHQKAMVSRDYKQALKNAVSAPARLGRSENKAVWVFLDHVQGVEDLFTAGRELFPYFLEAVGSPWAYHLFSGEPPGYLKKRLAGAFFTRPIAVRDCPPWTLEEAAAWMQALEERFGIKLARDLLDIWLDFLEGNPGVAATFLNDARWEYAELESHKRFAEAYLKSLIGGGLKRWFEPSFRGGSALEAAQGRYLLKGLQVLWKKGSEPTPVEELQRQVGLSLNGVQGLVSLMERAGFVQESFGMVEPVASRVLRDWVEVQVRRWILREEPRRIIAAMGGRLEEELHTYRDEEPQKEEEKAIRFTLVLPNERDAELVAVRALEQIATYSELEADQVEKIKMALIEACINAAEHSNSYEQKIRVRFAVTPQAIEVAVEDRGKAFDPLEVQAAAVRKDAPFEQRRGRGLVLIKEWMDEVRLENTEVGTRLVMIKKRRRKEPSS
jgi:serine/threonine-protein kinase RsbW